MNKILEEDICRFCDTFSYHGEFQGKTIVVTGATGLIGHLVVRCLLALEPSATVVAVVRSREKALRLLGMEHANLHFYLFNFDTDTSFTPPFVADFIIHLAAPTASRHFVEQPVETISTVVRGTETLLAFARRVGVKGMVFASTLEVYGEMTDSGAPITETAMGYLDTMSVRSGYPMAKRLSETLCHAYAAEYGVPVCVARLAQTFGAGVASDDNRVYAQFARAILQRHPITLHTDGALSRCYCYTTDVVAALLLLVLKGLPGEAYNVANEDTFISVRNMAEMVMHTFHSDGYVQVEPREGMGYSPVTALRLSSSKLRSLGWEPHYDLREMYERLIAFLEPYVHQG